MAHVVLPISHHLREFKIRIMYTIFSIGLAFLCSYHFSEEIFYLLAKPLIIENMEDLSNKNKIGFIYTNITEAFTTYMKISFLISLYVCFPVIIYQLWMFLVPGLYDYEKTKLGIFGVLSFFLFSLGALIAYLFIFPVAWKFFLSFQFVSTDGILQVQLQPKISQYLFLVIKILFLFGVCFQFPIYLVLLVQTNLITSEWCIKKRKIACVLCFIIAAMLSPPDVASQIIVVIPLLIFYEIAIFIMKLLEEYDRINK